MHLPMLPEGIVEFSIFDMSVKLNSNPGQYQVDKKDEKELFTSSFIS